MRIINGYNLRNLFVAILSLTCGALVSQAPLQLDEYLRLAVRHSPELRAAAVRLNAAERDIESLPRWYLPDLYVEAGYSGAANSKEDRVGPLARIVGEWTLWDGGRSDAEREVFERQQEVVRIGEQARLLGIQKTLALAYYRAARLEELRQIGAEEIAEYERLERTLGPRRRIGTAGASDVLNVRVRVEELRAEHAANGETILALRKSLLILAGVTTGDEQTPPPSIPRLREAFTPPEASHLSDEADAAKHVEHHPRYRVEQARLRLLKASEKLAERELYGATLGFEMYGGYGPSDDAIDPNRPEAGAAVRFRFPLYASRDRESRVQAGQDRLAALRLEKEQQLLELKIELLEHRAGIARDQRLLASFDRLLIQARSSLQLGYEEFRRGQKAPADMIAAIETLYQLKRKQTNTLLRYRLARFEEYSLHSIEDRTDQTESENMEGETK